MGASELGSDVEGLFRGTSSVCKEGERLRCWERGFFREAVWGLWSGLVGMMGVECNWPSRCEEKGVCREDSRVSTLPLPLCDLQQIPQPLWASVFSLEQRQSNNGAFFKNLPWTRVCVKCSWRFLSALGLSHQQKYGTRQG